MTSLAVSALQLASVAVQTEQFYNLVASAPGADFDASLLKVNDRFWHIGSASNSTCGDVSPAVTIVGGSLAIYSDGKSNQQYVFVDISGAADGLLAYTPANTPGGAPEGFELIGAEEDQIYLYYNNTVSSDNLFLACEDASAAGEYWVYPENSYGKSVGKEACVEFQIRADPIDQPTESCTYY